MLFLGYSKQPFLSESICKAFLHPLDYQIDQGNRSWVILVYDVLVHDGIIYLESNSEPFSTLLSLHARVFSSMNCNTRNVLTQPSKFLIFWSYFCWHITIFVTLKISQFNRSAINPNLGCKNPRPWKKSTNSTPFQWRWSSRSPRRMAKTRNGKPQELPRFSFDVPMASGGPGEPSKCCGCNTFAVQIEGVVLCHAVGLLLMIWQGKNLGINI